MDQELAPETAAPAPGRHGWRRDGPRFVLVAWLVTSVALVAAVASTAALVALVAALRAVVVEPGAEARLDELVQESLQARGATWAMLLASQATMLACAWLACRWLAQPARARLGLAPSGLSAGQGALLTLGTVVPFALGLGAAWLVERALGSSGEDELGLQRMWSEGSRAGSVAWVLAIALLPGFAEELFYRGFLQRGLLVRWRPATSILASSLLFAASHGELAWAAAIFPLGLWFGFVAWRTGSMRMSFVLHASVNGLWTAGMMLLHREPASEPWLKGTALATLALGALAFPWALALLRRLPAPGARASERPPAHFLARVGATSLAAGTLLFVLLPPGATPAAHESTSADPASELVEPLASVDSAVCTAMGEQGALELSLQPGAGVRVELPPNRAGIEHVRVELDVDEALVWLTYAGERSGKRGNGRPLGIVEQLASGAPTVLCLTLTPGPPPVRVRLTLEDDEERKLEAFARAESEGWARRGRK